MPSGAWRGEVVQISSRGVFVIIPRFSSEKLFGPIEGEPSVTYDKGDRVLCAFFEGKPDKIEIIRKTAAVTAPSGGSVFGAVFGGTF